MSNDGEGTYPFPLTREAPEGRGCGERDEEKPYACCGVGAGGSPIEAFVQDPVLPWLDDNVGRGAQILPRNPEEPDGVCDLVIIVGVNTGKEKDGYPFYWDYVEESRLYGASRKVSEDLPFERLTPGPGGSRMIFVHRLAIPQFEFSVVRDRPYYMCSKGFPLMQWAGMPEFGHHPPPPGARPPCAFAGKDLAWLFHETERLERPGMSSMFRVSFGSTSYTGTYPSFPAPCTDYSLCIDDKAYNAAPCKECPQVQKYVGGQFVSAGPAFRDKRMWKPGIFLALPLTHFEFRTKQNDEVVERLNKTGYEAVICDW